MENPLFRVYLPRTSWKVECTVCGRRGYDGGRWQDSCKRGHPFVCDECGAKFSTGTGKAAHVRARKDHHGDAQPSLF